MNLTNTKNNNIVNISIEGELDQHTAPKVRDYIERCGNEKSVKTIILDFALLNFMDSTGIGVILGRYKIFKPKGVQLLIKNPTSQIDRILKMSGVYEVVPKI